MRSKVRLRVNIEVEVEMECEIDPRSLQSNIISATIDPLRNPLTPRMVYASMNHGQYGQLDQATSASAMIAFLKRCEPYKNMAHEGLPEEEIRSLPEHPSSWKKTMSEIRGTNARIPLSVIAEAALKMSAHIEPVLCKTPTIYLWPANLADSLENVAAIKSSIKASNIEEMKDGSWKVTWRYPR